MKKILILLTISLSFTLLMAEERFFPSENGLIRIPISEEWSAVETDSNETYAIYKAYKGDMILELYIAGGQPIPPKEHLDSFLEGVNIEAFSFQYYTIESYDFYSMGLTENYAATGTRELHGEERRFVARSYFPDMYGVLLYVSVPEDQGEEYIAEMKSLLRL